MKKAGFTLMELLTVITIIVILVGLLFPAFGRARQQAKINKAKAMVGSLEVAVNMYFTDTGQYPANLGQLITPPQQFANFGPYMDNRDFDANGFRDPWWTTGNMVRYYQYAQPGVNNQRTFDVWSLGPDGIQGGGDNIGNW